MKTLYRFYDSKNPDNFIIYDITENLDPEEKLFFNTSSEKDKHSIIYFILELSCTLLNNSELKYDSWEKVLFNKEDILKELVNKFTDYPLSDDIKEQAMTEAIDFMRNSLSFWADVDEYGT